MNLPNTITVLRVAATPAIALLMYAESPVALLCSLVLFGLAMLGDIADGAIARRRDIRTTFGTFLDPVADKILILTMLIVLAHVGVVPMWVAVGMLWRELIVTGIRNVASARGDVIGANWMGKTKAALQTTTILAGQSLVAATAAGWMSGRGLAQGGAAVEALATGTLALSAIFAMVFVYKNRALLFDGV